MTVPQLTIRRRPEIHRSAAVMPASSRVANRWRLSIGVQKGPLLGRYRRPIGALTHFPCRFDRVAPVVRGDRGVGRWRPDFSCADRLRGWAWFHPALLLNIRTSAPTALSSAVVLLRSRPASRLWNFVAVVPQPLCQNAGGSTGRRSHNGDLADRAPVSLHHAGLSPHDVQRGCRRPDRQATRSPIGTMRSGCACGRNCPGWQAGFAHDGPTGDAVFEGHAVA